MADAPQRCGRRRAPRSLNNVWFLQHRTGVAPAHGECQRMKFDPFELWSFVCLVGCLGIGEAEAADERRRTGTSRKQRWTGSPSTTPTRRTKETSLLPQHNHRRRLRPAVGAAVACVAAFGAVAVVTNARTTDCANQRPGDREQGAGARRRRSSRCWTTRAMPTSRGTPRTPRRKPRCPSRIC